LSVSAGDKDSPSSPVEVIVVKPNDASVSSVPTDETTSSIPAISAPREEVTSSEANVQVPVSASNAAPRNATTNETAASSPKESAPQASTSSEFSAEPAPGTSVAAPADSRGGEPIDNVGTLMKAVLFMATLGLAVLGILSFAIPKLFKSEINKTRPSRDVGEIAASIASKLARNRGNARWVRDDLQQAEMFRQSLFRASSPDGKFAEFRMLKPMQVLELAKEVENLIRRVTALEQSNAKAE
jgi:hypothetical protein